MSLEIKDLNIILPFGDPVVEDIFFQFEEGKMLSIADSSGAGKTTVCKAVIGLLDNTYRAKRFILFHGRELLTLSDRERRTIYGKEICLIMQNPMTVSNPSIRIGRQLEKTYRLHHSRTSRKEMYELFLDLSQRLGLGDITRISNSYPFTLSGGVLQRLTIAAALTDKPSLLAMDEATITIGARSRTGLTQKLRGFCRKGMSALFITHNLRSASVSDRILVMDHEQVVERGVTEQILAMPPGDCTERLLNTCRLERRKWI